MTDTALKQWRTRLGLSQRDAAARLGLTLTAYQANESGADHMTGKSKKPKRYILLAAAAVEKNLEPIQKKP